MKNNWQDICIIDNKLLTLYILKGYNANKLITVFTNPKSQKYV